MEKHNPQSKAPARSEPKTQRGRETRDEILAAARTLVSERWVDEIPFVELASAAGVARASLLHAFPHWRDVLYDLLMQELDLLDESYETASALKRVRSGERAFVMLVVLLDRAEKTGRLYPNLRSAMFTWHGEPREEELSEAFLAKPATREMLGRFTRIPISDHYAAVEQLLRVPKDESLKRFQFGPQPVGECLVNVALDLAAGSPSYWPTFEERRQTLRSTIELLAAGLRSSKRGATKRPTT